MFLPNQHYASHEEYIAALADVMKEEYDEIHGARVRGCRAAEGKVLIPGVVDSTTNYIEHPELVAQRITRYAQLVGRENVLAGSDCGFATFASFLAIDPGITWAKLGAMAEGARLASDSLW